MPVLARHWPRAPTVLYVADLRRLHHCQCHRCHPPVGMSNDYPLEQKTFHGGIARNCAISQQVALALDQEVPRRGTRVTREGKLTPARERQVAVPGA